MRIARTVDVAPREIVLVLVGAVEMAAGGLMLTFGLVDVLRPQVQSIIAAMADVDPRLFDTTSPHEYRRRGKRRAVRGGAITAASSAASWGIVLVNSLD